MLQKLRDIGNWCQLKILYSRNFVLADLCLGRPQSWSEGRCEVNIMLRSNSSYWNELMRVQHGVLENESISSSCQTWCLTTSEWVNNHCYFLSFEHSISLQVLHSHSNRPRLKFLGGGIRSLGGESPQMCLDKTLAVGLREHLKNDADHVYRTMYYVPWTG